MIPRNQWAYVYIPSWWGRDGRGVCVPAFYGNWQLIQLREAHEEVIYVRGRGGQLGAPNAKTPCGMSKRSRLINAPAIGASGNLISQALHLHFL